MKKVAVEWRVLLGVAIVVAIGAFLAGRLSKRCPNEEDLRSEVVTLLQHVNYHKAMYESLADSIRIERDAIDKLLTLPDEKKERDAASDIIRRVSVDSIANIVLAVPRQIGDTSRSTLDLD